MLNLDPFTKTRFFWNSRCGFLVLGAIENQICLLPLELDPPPLNLKKSVFVKHPNEHAARPQMADGKNNEGPPIFQKPCTNLPHMKSLVSLKWFATTLSLTRLDICYFLFAFDDIRPTMLVSIWAEAALAALRLLAGANETQQGTKGAVRGRWRGG